jgi:hypothetical protein
MTTSSPIRVQRSLLYDFPIRSLEIVQGCKDIDQSANCVVSIIESYCNVLLDTPDFGHLAIQILITARQLRALLFLSHLINAKTVFPSADVLSTRDGARCEFEKFRQVDEPHSSWKANALSRSINS